MKEKKTAAFAGREQILDFLRSTLDRERLVHTLGAESLGLELAGYHGINPEKAVLACLGHDIARCLSLEEMKQYINKRKLTVPPDKMCSRGLLHGIIGADMLKSRFNIRDREVLMAVKYHTTGRPGMSPLEMLVYVVDLLEPSRNFKGYGKKRRECLKLAKVDLERACLEVLNTKLINYISRNIKINESTLRARNWLLEKLEKRKEKSG